MLVFISIREKFLTYDIRRCC